MTRIWLLSDLHQEFMRDPDWAGKPGVAFDPFAHEPASFDVAVLAGDIERPLTRAIEWIGQRFAGVPVVFVPGNHEFYVDPGSPLTVRLHHKDGTAEEFPVEHTYNRKQIDWFRAGSALNLIKEENR